MARDLRGFHYALAPLRQKYDWERQAAELTLAGLRGEINQVQQLLTVNRDAMAAALAEMSNHQAQGTVIRVDHHRVTMVYLADLQRQSQTLQVQLHQLETERDDAVREVYRLQQLADGLDEHREAAAQEYARTLETAAIGEADDAWLRGTHWRSTP